MEQALALIAEAKRTQAIRLDLGNCGLTELPDALFELTQLEVLILSSEWWEYDVEKKKSDRFISENRGDANNIRRLSPELGLLKAVKKLVIAGPNDVESELSDLTPSRDLANLQDLSVSLTQVCDLTPLKDLTNLQYFSVSSTQVCDLTPLKDLTNLQYFSVHSTQVSHLTPLKDLTNLQYLSVHSTQVCDLTPLKDLTNLQYLSIFETEVSDLTPLKGLTNLHYLSVHSTQVRDLTPLKGLTMLQTLSVFETHVSNLTPLKGLANLQYLDVYSTQVRDLTPLKGLANLQHLDVYSTQVRDLTPLKDLTNLQYLNVFETQVSDLTPLKGLANLQHLFVFDTQVSDLTPLKALTNLQSLDMSSTQVSDLAPLKDLVMLLYLNISSTRVNDLTPLKGLIELQQIDLSDTDVSDLSPLKGLIELQQIDLSGTNVSDLSPLEGLVELQQIDVHNTDVSDITPLKDLEQLLYLKVYNTNVSDITPLKDLANLQHLDVSDTEVSDITPLQDLVQLLHLGAFRTQVRDVTPLQYLTKLQTIDVSEAPVQDITPLKDLAMLQILDLISTQVSDLTPLKGLVMLQEVNVSGSPVQNIPKEIYDQDNCAEDLLAYWQELKTAQKVKNQQLKVMFLGNGCVGKSTLLHWFLNNEFTPISLEEGRTHGIFIKPYAFKNSDVLAHFWDFGGQEVFHATHRLFLGRRSLYVLVWTTESPEFNQDLQHPPQYWLDMIADIADPHERSRVLIVQNLFEGQTERNILSDAERADYEAKGLDITTYCFNAKTGVKVKTVMTAIEEEAEQLLNTHIEELPETWVNIRAAVAERRYNGEKMLDQADFEAICRDCRLTTNPSIILDYLHRAGELFYYRDHFKNQIILDQEWALNAVYAILKRKNIDQFKGRIRRAQLVQMWQADSLIQSEKEADIFLNFMSANKIAFYTDKGGFYQKDKAELVIPQLLPVETPEMYSLWARIPVPDKLRHRIAYQFLHRDIIERFIVQTAHLSEGKTYWRNGLFINYLGGEAVIEVIEIDAKKQIQIECVGAAKQELLKTIREEFNKIRILEKAVEWSMENGAWVVFSEKIRLEHGDSGGFEPSLPTHLLVTETLNINMKDHILSLIAEGKLKKALDIMRQIEQTQSKYFKDPLIGILSRYHRNQRSKDDGVITSEEYRIEWSRIESATKNLLDSEFDESRIPADLKSQIIETDTAQVVEVKEDKNAGNKQPDLKDDVASKIKILMLTANPAETTKLNLAKEHSKIVKKLQNQQSKFDLLTYDAVDRTGFKEITETNKPDILHFSGHGEKGGEYGGIIVQNEDNNGYEMISPQKLKALFGYFKKKFIIEAVVLNACFSQEQAEAIGQTVTYVVGTTKKIEDEHAISFSTGFYFYLANAASNISDAFESGRMEAILAGASESDFVLYKEGQQFVI
jgi:internalin A